MGEAVKRDVAKKTFIGLRMWPDDLAAVDALAARYPTLTRSDVMRAALRAGLRAISDDPLLLLSGGCSTRGRRRRR